jgi:5-bromo-4-chloroindolyl phosphate hydrolysis protein
LTKKEPKRFYKAERFYFSHLDSVLELTEKYAFLSSQPKISLELEHSLSETRRTLNELTEKVEQDLYYILSDDIDNLNFEIDVAKNSLKKN